MVNPINYTLNMADPAARVLEGAAAGQGLIQQAEQRGFAAEAAQREQEMQPLRLQQAELNIQATEQGLAAQRQQLEAARAEQAKRNQFNSMFADLVRMGPNATFEQFAELNAQFPEMAKGTMEFYDALDDNRKRPLVSTLAQAATAIKSGNVETGIEVAEQFVEAARAAGDETLAGMGQAALDLAKLNSDAAFAQIGTLLHQVDPDLAKSVLAGEQTDLEALEMQARAGGLEEGTPEYKRFILSGGKQFDASGPDFETEQKLRKEFLNLPVVKDFSAVKDAFGKVEAATKDPSAAGDLALIFNFMKMLDPGSVVREGEFATAQNAAGVPQQVQNLYNRALTGERLAESQRADFVNQAKAVYASQEGNYNETVDTYRDLSEQYKLSPDRVANKSDVEVIDERGAELSDLEFIQEMSAKRERGEQFSEEEIQRIQAISQGSS